MEILHTGLAVSSEEKADRFFIDILELEKSEPKILDKKLTQAIFGINNELFVIHYQDHSCIKVTDLAKIVNKCKEAGLKVVEVPKGSVVITFISDYDGNLFELKE